MYNKQKFIAIATVATSFFSLGCGILPAPKEVDCEAGCQTGPGGWKCEAKCRGRFKTIADATQWGYYVEPSNSAMDISASNVSVTGLMGTGTVKTKTAAGATVQTGNFAWQRSGTKLILTNPGAVAQVLDNSLGQAIEVEYSYKNINVEPTAGMNVFNSKVQYNGQSLISAQDSWYCEQASGAPPGVADSLCGVN